VRAARDVIPLNANPEHPEEVDVSRPSDALAARAAAKGAFTALFLGLGAVALLVGGVGIANVMVISVLERRSEVGLRRALGARRRHVAAQFFAEALLLSVLGGGRRRGARRAGHRRLCGGPGLADRRSCVCRGRRPRRSIAHRRRRRPLSRHARNPPVANRSAAVHLSGSRSGP